MTIALVSNALGGPADEGTRKLAQILGASLRAAGGLVLTVDDTTSGRLRRVTFDPGLVRSLRAAGVTVVVYLPTQGLTAATYLRVQRLRRAARCKVLLVSAQGRPPLPAERLWARRAGPDLLLSPSTAVVDQATAAGIDARFLGLGVDADTFVPAGAGEREAVRAEMGLGDGPLLLHVGHASPNRNLDWLVRARRETGAEVVLVIGRSQGVDEEVVRGVRAAGIRVISEFVPDITRLYASADCYVFPVLQEQGAIGVPLSVLEAMACNLPVVTTPFGGLPSMFEPGSGLYFETSEDAWVDAIRTALSIPRADVRTRALVEPHSWQSVVDRVLDGAATLS